MLVGLQVLSSKGGKEEEGELFDKILLAWAVSLSQPWGQLKIAWGVTWSLVGVAAKGVLD